MTGAESLLARVVLGSVAAVCSLVLASARPLQALPQRRFDRALVAAFTASRLGLFLIVFLVFRIAPRGDVPAYYFDQAKQVLLHRLPYRDFPSSYAPLHPYLDAALISLWRTPLAIMLFSVLAELALLPLWLNAGRKFLPEAEIRVASLLYLASPISLQFVAVDGQDNVVIAVLVALATVLLLRSRLAVAGATFGASIAGIKFLPLLYAPAFLLVVPRRWRFLAGAMAVCAAVYAGFWLAGAPVLGPLVAEGDLRSAGDLPYVIEAVLGVALAPRLMDGLLLAVLAGISALIGWAGRRASLAVRVRAFTFGMAALTLALLLLSKKSWPPYLMLALFPICLSAGRSSWRVLAFAVFGVIAVGEHSYWANSFALFSSHQFHSALMAGRPDAFLLLGVELLLILGYAWLLSEAIRQVFLARQAGEGPDSREMIDSSATLGYS